MLGANFQYCHGFAFISDLGAQKLAEGYLAIQLDELAAGLDYRTGVIGENQGSLTEPVVVVTKTGRLRPPLFAFGQSLTTALSFKFGPLFSVRNTLVLWYSFL